MKKYLFAGLMGLFLWACSSPKETAGSSPKAPLLLKDSTEYEITILDPGFDFWFVTHYSPILDRTNSDYLSLNRMPLMNWNRFFTDARYRKEIDSFIPYPPGTDFGLEANRKLYWYFKYVESTYKVPLFR